MRDQIHGHGEVEKTVTTSLPLECQLVKGSYAFAEVLIDVWASQQAYRSNPGSLCHSQESVHGGENPTTGIEIRYKPQSTKEKS